VHAFMIFIQITYVNQPNFRNFIHPKDEIDLINSVKFITYIFSRHDLNIEPKIF
jgi:hypothetical protein